MNSWTTLLSVGLAAVFASPSQSASFEEADALFRQRTIENTAVVDQARATYAALIDSATTEQDKIYAAAQTARLDYFKGSVQTPLSERAKRKAIFQGCLDTIQAISPDQLGGKKTQEYYFWRATCLARWGQVAAALEVVGRVGELRRLVNEGKALGADYEGGGLLRTASGVFLNRRAQPFGLYKPEEALELIEEALESEGKANRAFPDGVLTGYDYYDNYFYQASALIELGRSKEAQEIIEDAIDEIEERAAEDDLPLGREQETLYDLKNLKELLATLS